MTDTGSTRRALWPRLAALLAVQLFSAQASWAGRIVSRGPASHVNAAHGIAVPGPPEIPSLVPPSAGLLGRLPADKGISMGAYIVPNERETYLYAPVLKGRQGALISVGTIRALNAGVLGDFSHLILFDYDALATRFNQAHLELIKASGDRFEYLANLLARPLDAELLDAVRSGKISDERYLAQLIFAPRSSGKDQSREVRRVQEVLADIPSHRRYGPWSGGREVDRMGVALSKFNGRPQQWQRTYFGSGALYSKLKEKVLEGRVGAVNGNLVGKKTLPALAKALRREGVEVSAVDISNATQYFIGSGGGQFVKNLEALPLSPDAVVLFTAKTMRPDSRNDASRIFKERFFIMEPGTSDGWLYFAVPARSYLRAGASGRLESQEAFMAYMKRVFERANRAYRMFGLVVAGEPTEK